jgi:phenylacetate-CoA ligase
MIRNLLELLRIVKNRKLPASRLKELRERKLRAVIRNAYEHVPYYRSLFRSVGLAPEDIRTLEDLEQVPVTTKDDLRAVGIENITAKWVDISTCVKKRTGGSLGKAFTVYRTEREQRTVELVMTASQFAAGCRPWDRIANLGADIRLPEHLYHRLGLYRRAIIPIRLPIEAQIQRLQEFQPTVLMSWPSAVRAVMHNIQYPLRNLVNPKVLISVSEVFDDVLRKRLKDELDADLFNMYAAHEFAQIAMECHTHEGLHLQADHLVLESLDDGKAVGHGHQGVAVITSLNSFAMPFIRYNLGDLVVLWDKECSCGSSFPLMGHPLGRVNDLLTLPSGTMLSPQGFYHILRDFSGMDQWRIIQETESHFILKLAAPQEPGEEFLSSLRAQILEYLREPVTLDIELVSHIEEERLKFRHFISKITP